MAADIESIVRDNLAKVRERIADACAESGRSPEGVTLVGVSKYVGPAETAALVAAGCDVLGEARPQQLWEKAAAQELAALPIRWRLIGHLQRNKATRTVPICDSIDSVDSPRLLKAVASAAEAAGKWQRILLEVNVSGDAEKHGFTPDATADALGEAAETPSLEVRGLMGMAAREGGVDVARRNFADLRRLRDRLATPALPLKELSMGMSGDLEAAIAEGATHVRVGSALWQGLR
ncbi:MAG: YggS family pyridoxal phosphate-dependent enzyme [Planctomycetota bacterium]